MDIISVSGLKALGFITYPDIKIHDNAATFITGESGCGKSTLLRLFNATLLPDEGTVLCNGRDISDFDKAEYRRRILLVPQEIFLTDGTIKENFDFYYDMRGETPPDSDKISEYLKLCCLEHMPDMPCGVLSGGERQRVFIAIFLSFEPPVLLLDEPTSALDGVTARKLLAGIKEHCRLNGTTLVTVCHSEELTEAFADSIIRLQRSTGE